MGHMATNGVSSIFSCGERQMEESPQLDTPGDMHVVQRQPVSKADELVFAMDPEIWDQHEQARSKVSPGTGGCIGVFTGVCFTPPWVPAFPLCVPMMCRCCPGYEKQSLPAFHDRALVLTDTGLTGYNNYYTNNLYGTSFSADGSPEAFSEICCATTETPEPRQSTILWHDLNLEEVKIEQDEAMCPGSCIPICDLERYGQIVADDLAIRCGCGLLFPCCCCICYKEHVPGYYRMFLQSKSGHTEDTSGQHGSSSKFMPDHYIQLFALKEDSDVVFKAIKARSS